MVFGITERQALSLGFVLAFWALRWCLVSRRDKPRLKLLDMVSVTIKGCFACRLLMRGWSAEMLLHDELIHDFPSIQDASLTASPPPLIQRSLDAHSSGEQKSSLQSLDPESTPGLQQQYLHAFIEPSRPPSPASKKEKQLLALLS
ncbi:hypothetical protein NDU88_001077 [Pleurodeles waltl]|uniref:Uncharacterized protein n=1 Tax=Pleurodeles waltl TaxID=8319 RepID=A0AAV7WHC8_PLEWA|nr:hypothetical protein NDU88_001077 [Pleurodeles waltl]